MKVIFLGTPEFAVPSLEALLKTSWIKILAVCTQTDKEAGRGKHLKIPEVKELAIKNNLTVIQTNKIAKEKEAIEKLKEYKPDIFISCSYGQILSQEILDIAPVINVHASLLPKYRGAAPVNWAILNGETETGITIMKTELSLDAGPIILQERCTIDPNETSIDLFKNLSCLGASILIHALEQIKAGKAQFIPQDDSKATKAPALKKELGLIHWNRTAKEIHNKIRGLQPWPSAYTHYSGKIIKIWESRDVVHNVSTTNNNVIPGTIVEIKDYIKIRTGNGYLDIYKLQPENKNIVKSKDWVNGAHIKIGERFN